MIPSLLCIFRLPNKTADVIGPFTSSEGCSAASPTLPRDVKSDPQTNTRCGEGTGAELKSQACITDKHSLPGGLRNRRNPGATLPPLPSGPPGMVNGAPQRQQPHPPRRVLTPSYTGSRQPWQGRVLTLPTDISPKPSPGPVTFAV